MAPRVIAIVAVVAIAACGTSESSSSSRGEKVRIIAAENFWGSIASQVGGEHASVTSIIQNPSTDPHDYEATPTDARAIASAQYVIANGVGYDSWAQKLIDANPVAGRRGLVVGDLVGVKEGGNPHLWYSPDYVKRFVDRVTSDLAAVDPAEADYFRARGQTYRVDTLTPYLQAVGAIKQKYAGTKVGATESVFSYLADATGLDLVTPYSYLKAVSEGQDPSAADKAEVEREITTREIRVFIYNSQNSTPDVQGLVEKARAAALPVVSLTETLTPQGATFQEWQTRQLGALLVALGG